MSPPKAGKVALYRILAVAVPLALVELACRIGWINALTLPPPSRMAVGLVEILQSGRMNGAMLKTLGNVLTAFAAASVAGIAAGAAIHRLVGETLSEQELLDGMAFAIAAAVILPLAWLGALMAVFQLSDNPHSWVLSVWGESHPAWDLLTAAAGIACACTEGNALWKGWME